MYTIDKCYKGCQLVGRFYKNCRCYKIYQLPENTRYLGFTSDQLFEIFNHF